MKMIGIALIIFLLVSCAPSPQQEISVDNPYAPQEGDSGLTRAKAYVEIADWSPADNKLHLAGSLPTPCNQLRVSFTQAEGKLTFDVYSLTDPKQMCAEMIQPFDVFLAVKNMPVKGISILVNGEVIFSQ
ncbi:MAG: hypothetical protein Q8N39_10465 [Pelolinea sp.]|nr:hypothetical protein [Pelolinea sp.]